MFAHGISFIGPCSMAIIQCWEFPLIDFCGWTNIYWADGFVVFLNGLVAAMLCPLVLDNRARNDGDANNPPELHLID